MKKAFCFSLLIIVPLLMKAQKIETDSSDYGLNYHKGKGFEFKDKSGNFLMQMEWRLQVRTAYPMNGDFVKVGYPEETIYLGINRARMKVGGYAFSPKIQYYMEYELARSALLNYRVIFSHSPALNFKVGQWKAQYSAERIISSGKQQAVDRSIVNRAFTLDRQQGVSLLGNLGGKNAANFNYWLTALMGNGRGASTSADPYLMYMSRLQWNPNGSVLKFSGSDIEYHEKFKMLLAVAGVTNRSEFTRFSTSGGGQLEGFEPGLPGQYRVNQLLQESAGKYRGFSWQQELHFKGIDDKVNLELTKMWGNVAQCGYFPGQALKKIPKNLEVFVRHAFYYPDFENNDHIKKEFTLGGNWFFYGHKMKVTADASYLDSNFQDTEIYYGWRYRLQLDISL